MSEDPLLHELGRLAQEEKEAEDARRDERWDRLAAGTLGAEEDAALRTLAATSPAAREAYEAFRPLGEASRPTDDLPIGRPVAGAFKAVPIHKTLHPPYGHAITLGPVTL